MVPLSDFAASFWNHIRLELGAQGINAGFAIFSYCERGNELSHTIADRNFSHDTKCQISNPGYPGCSSD